MTYTLSFQFPNRTSYPMSFIVNTEGIYPLYFSGMSIDEVIKYTRKYVHISSRECQDIERGITRAAEECSISVGKLIEVAVESFVHTEITQLKRKGAASVEDTYKIDAQGADFVQDVQTRVVTYVNTVINSSNTMKLWRSVTAVTPVSRQQMKCYGDMSPGELVHTESLHLEKPITTEITRKGARGTESYQEVKIRSISARIEDSYREITHQHNIHEIIPMLRELFRPDRKVMAIAEQGAGVRQFKLQESSLNISKDVIPQVRRDSEGISSEITKRVNKVLGNTDSEIQFNTRESFEILVEVATPKLKIVGYNRHTAIDRYALKSVDNANISINKTAKQLIDPLVQTTTTRLPSIEGMRAEVITAKVQMIDPRLGVQAYSYKGADWDTSWDTTKYSVKDADVHVEDEVVIYNTTKLLSISKRWRFRTGDIKDKIWINPYNGDGGFLFDEVITVEASISLKAMLDFILFIEQLMYANRFFYGGSRAVAAVDNMIYLLTEWLVEAKPEEIVPDEYLYLYRWYKWWAEGERGKHLNDINLNGYIVLGTIRDNMVKYFENRWGKRVVEYSTNEMLVYSIDKSFIDRVRTKKHGSFKNPTENVQMKEIYGLDETQVPYSIEREEKL